MVGRATDGDSDAIVATLVASHLDHAWEVWALPEDGRAERLAVLFRTALTTIGQPHGQVFTTDRCESVAVWVPADADQRLSADDLQALVASSTEAYGERAAMVAEASAVIASAATPPARWYLATMGTRPERQRRGLGESVLQPMLRTLDKRGEGARLETSDPANVAWYRKFGFEVLDELADLPHGAPTTWVMFRPPRSR